MTKQSNAVVKRGFMMVTEILAPKNILVLALAVFMAFSKVGVQARSMAVDTVEMAMPANIVVGSVSLNTSVPGGSVVIYMNAAFAANHPEADLSASLNAEGDQLAVVVADGPASGAHTVGVIDILNDEGQKTAYARVKLIDGVLETTITDL